MIRAYLWRSKLESGQFKSLDALARAEKKSATYSRGPYGNANILHFFSAAEKTHRWLRQNSLPTALSSEDLSVLCAICAGKTAVPRYMACCGDWVAVLPVMSEIVSAAKTKKQGIKLGNPALQPRIPLTLST
jgi:hypothetical protein